MKKSLIISEADNIAALLENDRVVEFFVNRGELLLGDVYTATVENILPGIDAAFVNLGKDKMGFLHANDVPGTGTLKEKLVPKQKLLVQITKEPTGHKGPRVSTAVSLPGRFLVLVPEERSVSISRRISEAKERARLKAVVNLMKPPGVGLIIRTEAKGQGEQELFEDFESLWDRWQTIVSDGEGSIGPTLIYRDQDLLFRVIRDAYSNDINEIIVDTPDGQKRALDYMQGWASRNTKVLQHVGDEAVLIAKGIDREIEAALSDRVELPSGGHLNIQPTEALMVIDVNSGRFTSSRTQAETVRRTNVEAAQEIPRQLRLRNIGGMVIVDFIDMDSRRDQQQVLEQFSRALEDDRAKPQIGQLSDLGLVELTRRRQGQSLRELFTGHCPTCAGLGVVPTLELGFGENRHTLTFKSREEDLLNRGRRRGMAGRQQSTVLRAATVGGGRIQPTLLESAAPEHDDDDEEDDLIASVPDEILEQVPDELLGQAFGKTAHIDLDDDDDDEEDDEDDGTEALESKFSEETRGRGLSRGPVFTSRFSEDVIEAEPVETTVTIHEEFVPRARYGLIAGDEIDDTEDHVAVEAHVAHPEDVVTTIEIHIPHETRHEVEVEAEAVTEPVAVVEVHAEVEEEVEPPPPLHIPESPYQTEVDPITGIYRLKAKTPPAAACEVSATGSSEAGHHEHCDAAAHEHQGGEHAHHSDSCHQGHEETQSLQNECTSHILTAETIDLADTTCAATLAEHTTIPAEHSETTHEQHQHGHGHESHGQHDQTENHSESEASEHRHETTQHHD